MNAIASMVCQRYFGRMHQVSPGFALKSSGLRIQNCIQVVHPMPARHATSLAGLHPGLAFCSGWQSVYSSRQVHTTCQAKHRHENYAERGTDEEWGDSDVDAAKAVLMRTLSARPAPASKLLQKLAEKGYHPDAAAAALARLQDLGLQSDEDFAEVYARSKWRQSRWAPARISLELRRQQVAEEHISKALRHVFSTADNGSIGANDDNGHLEVLLSELRRMEQRSSSTATASPEARKRRIAGWLQRRGHSWDTVKYILDQLGLL